MIKGAVINPDTAFRESSSGVPLLVVTDLDGTLLDHRTYSYAPALPALRALEDRGIPLILCSSKTRAEIRELVEVLENRHPFVVENGSAICANPRRGEVGTGVGEDQVLGRPYQEIIPILQQLRAQYHFEFRGFADMSTEEVAAVTGLPADAARLAKMREFSEPLMWEDSDERKIRFLAALEACGLTAQQGGRFLTVSGRSDKGRAVMELRLSYGAGRVIALGDSYNDRAMLEAADIAVIVRSDHSERLAVKNSGHVIYTEKRGPEGWNSAILELLEEYDNG